MLPIKNTVLILAALVPVGLHADTVIELLNEKGKSRFLTDGNRARINTMGNNEYMLVDFKRNIIYAVMPDQKQIINITESMPSMNSDKAPDFRLKITPAGKGPSIAGYPTTIYRLSAGGENCGMIYGSKDALKGTSVKKMFNTMKIMADNQRKALGGYAAAIPPCQLAKMELASQIQNIGAPLKAINRNGQVESEVTKINKNTSVDPSYYALPANYKKVSMADRISEAQRENQQMDRMQQTPQMQQMMRQMQESGQLPPEAIEQMKRYQETMQQR